MDNKKGDTKDKYSLSKNSQSSSSPHQQTLTGRGSHTIRQLADTGLPDFIGQAAHKKNVY